LGDMLKSVTAIYVAVAAIAAAVTGVLILPLIGGLGVPGEWTTPVILAVFAATLAVSRGLFWLSDLLVRQLVGSTEHHPIPVWPHHCFLCGANLLPGAPTCPSCGTRVRGRQHPRSASRARGDG
jgi:hypothetical protein